MLALLAQKLFGMISLALMFILRIKWKVEVMLEKLILVRIRDSCLKLNLGIIRSMSLFRIRSFLCLVSGERLILISLREGLLIEMKVIAIVGKKYYIIERIKEIYNIYSYIR